MSKKADQLPPLFTLAEVAEMIGMHPGSLRKRLSQGRSDAIRVGGGAIRTNAWMFTADQVEELRKVARPRGKRRDG